MNRIRPILIGFLASLFIFLGSYFNVLYPNSVVLILLTPILGGLISAYLSKGNYREGLINGFLSFLPLLIILTILSFMILNISFNEPLLNGNWGHDLLQIVPILIIFFILIFLNIIGSIMGVYIRNISK